MENSSWDAQSRFKWLRDQRAVMNVDAVALVVKVEIGVVAVAEDVEGVVVVVVTEALNVVVVLQAVVVEEATVIAVMALLVVAGDVQVIGDALYQVVAIIISPGVIAVIGVMSQSLLD